MDMSHVPCQVCQMFEWAEVGRFMTLATFNLGQISVNLDAFVRFFSRSAMNIAWQCCMTRLLMKGF